MYFFPLIAITDNNLLHMAKTDKITDNLTSFFKYFDLKTSSEPVVYAHLRLSKAKM